MKKLISLTLAFALTVICASCGSTSGQNTGAPSTDNKTNESIEASAPEQEQETANEQGNESSPETEAPEQETEPAAEPEPEAEPAAEAEPGAESSNSVLVVYFSATGTTKGVAEKIAAVTGADLYEIVPAEPYSDEDLNYNDSSTRATMEQNDKSARPAIGSEEIDLAGYTTIYIGFPIWWGEEPRIMDTFVESYDFTGITLIPFCTSGGSGIGRSGPNMEKLAGSGTWLDGERFSGSVSEAELQTWTSGLK